MTERQRAHRDGYAARTGAEKAAGRCACDNYLLALVDPTPRSLPLMVSLKSSSYQTTQVLRHP